MAPASTTPGTAGSGAGRNHSGANAGDTNATVDTDAPLDPAAMLALSESQQRSVHSKMGGFVPLITGTWAGAWLIGFLALWSIDGLDGAASLSLPLAIGVFIAVMLIEIGRAHV